MWNFKEVLLWWLLTIPAVQLYNTTTTKVQDYTQNEIINVISNDKNDKSNVIDTIEYDSIKTEWIEDIKSSPLFMEWTNRHIWEFLWYNQYNNIMNKYNDCYFDKNTTSEEKKIYNFEQINFPLIYDWLDTILPDNIPELLEQDFLKDYKTTLQGSDDIIIIKNIWEKFALWYYKNWCLHLATHVSIWKWNMTPTWLFYINYKIPRHKSKKYNNAAMPYAINLKWNYFMHQWKVTWWKLSHGCVRVPWLYQKEIFESTQQWTPVIISY